MEKTMETVKRQLKKMQDALEVSENVLHDKLYLFTEAERDFTVPDEEFLKREREYMEELEKYNYLETQIQKIKEGLKAFESIARAIEETQIDYPDVLKEEV